MNKINNYRVLARKYRPKAFRDLVGQDVLVKTLNNAILDNKIYHAFILTGMRGVGKTTTARIIARSLNCVSDKQDEYKNIIPCGECDQCVSIDSSSNVDVIEIDAASNTGVANIREIIDNVRYRAVGAKYKVYVIDEVHMLSTAAFNALLKTLEEPPSNIIFILATTEIRKVPVTVLSRCQRFDLRRVSDEKMIAHLSHIAKLENVNIENPALSLIVSASEGSVRDSLSLLDQSISFCEGEIKEYKIREMLGLSGRSNIVSLFNNILKGEIKEALQNAQGHSNQGVDSYILIQELMGLCHWVTKYKITQNDKEDITLGENEKKILVELSQEVSFANLTRVWQMLIKGLDDMNKLPLISGTLEMLLVKITFASNLPDPASLVSSMQDTKKKALNTDTIRGFDKSVKSNAKEMVANNPLNENTNFKENISKENFILQEKDISEKKTIESFTDLINLTEKKDEFIIRSYLLSNVHIISFEHGKISLRLKNGTPKNFINQLSVFLTNQTDIRWLITLSNKKGNPTIKEKEAALTNEINTKVRSNPIVSVALESIPGAEIKNVNDISNERIQDANKDDHEVLNEEY